MTITIPAWLLWGIGIPVAILVVIEVAGLAFIGLAFILSFGRRW